MNDVLAAMRKLHAGLRPAEIARVLNFDGPCEWAPVGPPRKGEKCASVPVNTRRAVDAILKRLLRDGKITKLDPGTRWTCYVLPDREYT